MTVDFRTVDWRVVKARSCDCKTRYPGPGPARAAADKASRSTGEIIRPYRCLFGPGAHWHIGHPPSDLAAMERLAAAIRNHQNDTTQECA